MSFAQAKDAGAALSRSSAALAQVPGPIVAAVTAVLYLASAQYVIFLNDPVSAGAGFWPPAGVSIAALLLLPKNRWGWVLGAVAAAEVGGAVIHGYPAEGYFFWAAGNVVEPWAAALLFTRFGGRGKLAPVSSLLRFLLFAVLLGPLLGALIGGIGTPLAFGNPYPDVVLRWLMGDALGVLVVAPLLLTLSEWAFRRSRIMEATALAVMVVLATFLSFFSWHADWGSDLNYLTAPVLIWAGLRFGVAGAAAAGFVVAQGANLATGLGLGPFGGLHHHGSDLLLLQVFIAVSLMTSLVVAALASDLEDRTEVERVLNAQAEALRESEARFRDYAEVASDWLWETDDQHRFTSYVGGTSGNGTPLPLDMIGMRPWEYPQIAEEQDIWAKHIRFYDERLPFRDFRFSFSVNGKVRSFSTSGTPVYGAEGKYLGYRGITADVTDRKTAEAEVWRMANQDWLTGLPNRRLFQTRFDDALTAAKAAGTAVSLLMIDLDDFKDVNDTLGHHAGDALLKETAERLNRFVRGADTLARLGGDEFAILIVAPLTLQNVVLLGDEIVSDLRRPFTYGSRVVASRASVGIASFPEHYCTAPDLMKAADIALYRAKSLGRNRSVAYSTNFRVAAELRVSILGGVRDALGNQQIVPFYQPKFDLKSGQVAGFEALARWQHPTKGLLTPEYFGAAFDDPELAELIGKAMLAQVARDICGWLAETLDCGRVGLNFSAAEFRTPTLAETVLAQLAEFGVPTANFEVEVTESVFLAASAEHVSDILQAFKLAGVSVALDDFGTGFASLSHLKRFPVDHIKVDQSFVHGLGTNEDDTAIVSAVVGLAKALGLQVTAEGIETEGQAQILCKLGCEYGQGYLWAKPMVGTRVPNFLRSWPGRASAVTQDRNSSAA